MAGGGGGVGGRLPLLLLDQLGHQPPQEGSGGLSAAFQGEAGRHAPGARPGSVPRGSSPPAEAAHRPDPAARVPGRVDVGGWKQREERMEACALVGAALVAGPGVCSAHGCLSPRPCQDHPPAQEARPERPFLVLGWLWEVGFQTHTRTHSPSFPVPTAPFSWVTCTQPQATHVVRSDPPPCAGPRPLGAAVGATWGKGLGNRRPNPNSGMLSKDAPAQEVARHPL